VLKAFVGRDDTYICYRMWLCSGFYERCDRKRDRARAPSLASRQRREVALSGLAALPSGPLRGDAAIPGDKSISHRALIIGALAVGQTSISGLLEADDVRRTAQALRQLGATITGGADGVVGVHGRGVGGLGEPGDVLDLGNAGTGARLLMGVVAAHGFVSVFTGDESLRRRPMARVTAPLEEMGARITARDGGRLPLTVRGTDDPMPITYRLPVPSAQVKSAILLAGLNTPGRTRVIEPVATRDHTERMLAAFGVEIAIASAPDGGRVIDLIGQPELPPQIISVPGDPSAAAFPITAALVVPGSRVTAAGVGHNPLRRGLFEVLGEMGGRLEIVARSDEGGEPTVDVTAEFSALEGIEIAAERAPRMIDEYPILAVAAACARGRTVMHGLGELRVKESDRLAAIAAGLTACGVRAEIAADTLIVDGHGGPPPGGGHIQTHHDHRMAMSFLVLGMAARKPVTIDDGAPIATSFPGFVALMSGLGGRIEAPTLRSA